MHMFHGDQYLHSSTIKIVLLPAHFDLPIYSAPYTTRLPAYCMGVVLERLPKQPDESKASRSRNSGFEFWKHTGQGALTF